MGDNRRTSAAIGQEEMWRDRYVPFAHSVHHKVLL